MSTPRQPRDAFTLVELLVVVVIIAMLTGLLIPAVLSARATSRITQCTNNQKNLSAALVEYELAKQQFPGYVNRVSGADNPASWPVMILQRIDRADVWDAWRSGDDGEPLRVPLFVCPSEGAADRAALSYVANCGQQDAGIRASATTQPDWAANGVFHNHCQPVPPPPNTYITIVNVSASDIKDGTQHTLLISENNQAARWVLPSTPPPSGAINVQEPAWGMVWWKNNDTKVFDINQGYDEVAAGYDYARPSSYHAGGVVATFCDGHTQFLNEGIDYNVYALLMTPDGAKAKSTKTGNSMPGQTTKLEESMLK
jgi:prepilin-type N-terminal cleavage/methylation domain-containing protein/prepilin-type processing-associated H-X9-DG protein